MITIVVLLIAFSVIARWAGLGATAVCADGSYSWSIHHRGTCSWHGGVKKWMK